MNTTNKYIELNSKTLKELRDKLYEENYICPICNEVIEYNNVVLDHQHKTYKDQEIGEDGAGLVRGILCRNCNSFEGKVSNSFRRLGLHKKTDISTVLRGLADYLEQDNLEYVHPREVPKPKKLKKSSYNKLVKISTVKVPKYTRNYTKALEKLFIRFKIEPKFYS